MGPKRRREGKLSLPDYRAGHDLLPPALRRSWFSGLQTWMGATPPASLGVSSLRTTDRVGLLSLHNQYLCISLCTYQSDYLSPTYLDSTNYVSKDNPD